MTWPERFFFLILLLLRFYFAHQQLAYPPQFNLCLNYRQRYHRDFFRHQPRAIILPTQLKPGCYRLGGFWQRRQQRLSFIAKTAQPLSPGHPLVWQYRWQQFWAGWRRRLSQSYQRWLPSPSDTLLAGIVLGQKTQLPRSWRQQLQRTGTIHIVVASGYNLTVISQPPLTVLASWLGRQPALILAFFLVWIYTSLAGFQIPVVRAALMISFVYLAQFIGKKFAIWRAILASVYLMLLYQPYLLGSVSFQLSLAALSGILLLAPRFHFLPHQPWLGETLAETLAAEIMVLPLIAYHFNQLTLLAPLANLFILPLIPSLMGLGLLSLALGLLSGYFAAASLWLSYPLLWFFQKDIQFWSQFHLSQLHFHFPFILVGLYYLAIFLICQPRLIQRYWRKSRLKLAKS